MINATIQLVIDITRPNNKREEESYSILYQTFYLLIKIIYLLF